MKKIYFKLINFLFHPKGTHLGARLVADIEFIQEGRYVMDVTIVKIKIMSVRATDCQRFLWIIIKIKTMTTNHFFGHRSYEYKPTFINPKKATSN